MNKEIVILEDEKITNFKELIKQINNKNYKFYYLKFQTQFETPQSFEEKYFDFWKKNKLIFKNCQLIIKVNYFKTEKGKENLKNNFFDLKQIYFEKIFNNFLLAKKVYDFYFKKKLKQKVLFLNIFEQNICKKKWENFVFVTIDAFFKGLKGEKLKNKEIKFYFLNIEKNKIKLISNFFKNHL